MTQYFLHILSLYGFGSAPGQSYVHGVAPVTALTVTQEVHNRYTNTIRPSGHDSAANHAF